MSPIAAQEPITVPPALEFEQIYRDFAPLVYRTAWGVLGSREDAEDVLQTVFLRLLRRESQPDFQTNPKAYFYKAAVNVSLDALKARRRRPVLVDDIGRLDIPVPSSNGRFDEEMYQRLYAAIGQLSPEATEVLLLRTIGGMNGLSLSLCLPAVDGSPRYATLGHRRHSPQAQRRRPAHSRGGPAGRGGGTGRNVFRASRYGPDFPGLAGKPLTPGKALVDMAP